MDTLTQSNAYLNELASNPIQFGSNPMGSASDSTEFGVALREFELARMVSRPGIVVSCLDRIRSVVEQVLKNQESAANDDFSNSIRASSNSIRSISKFDPSRRDVDRTCRRRFQTSESSFRD